MIGRASQGKPRNESIRRTLRLTCPLLTVLRQSADREALPPGKPQEASTPPGCRTHRLAGRDRLAYVPPHLPFVARRNRRSDEGAAGADASRLHPDDDEHLWTGDERFQTQSQQPGRWAGIRRNDGVEKGGVKHNSPSVEGLNQWPFPIGG